VMTCFLFLKHFTPHSFDGSASSNERLVFAG